MVSSFHNILFKIIFTKCISIELALALSITSESHKNVSRIVMSVNTPNTNGILETLVYNIIY